MPPVREIAVIVSSDPAHDSALEGLGIPLGIDTIIVRDLQILQDTLRQNWEAIRHVVFLGNCYKLWNKQPATPNDIAQAIVAFDQEISAGIIIAAPVNQHEAFRAAIKKHARTFVVLTTPEEFTRRPEELLAESLH